MNAIERIVGTIAAILLLLGSAAPPAQAQTVVDRPLRHGATHFFDVDVDLPQEGSTDRVQGHLVLTNRFEVQTFTVTLHYPALKSGGDVVRPAQSADSYEVGGGATERIPVSFPLHGQGKKWIMLGLQVESDDGVPLGVQHQGLYFRVDGDQYRRTTYEELYLPEGSTQVLVPETDSTELLEGIVIPTESLPGDAVVEPIEGDRLTPEANDAGADAGTGGSGDPVLPPGLAKAGPGGGPSSPVGAGFRAEPAAVYQVEGEFSYRGIDGGLHPAWAWSVVVAVEIPGGALIPLDQTYVQPDGSWSVRFERPGYAGQNLHVLYSPGSPYALVRGRVPYLFRGPGAQSIGRNFDMGHQGIDLSASGIVAGLGDMYRWTMDYWNRFESAGFSVQRDDPINVIFPNTWYQCGGNNVWSCAGNGGNVWIIPRHAGDPGTIHHELGHQAHHEYWASLPEGAAKSHSIDNCYNPGLAITEGLATATALWVQEGAGVASPTYSGFDHEDLTVGFCPGSTNESRVTAFFWDLLDRHDDGLDGWHLPDPVDAFRVALTAGTTEDVRDLRSDYRNAVPSSAHDDLDDIYVNNTLSVVRGPSTDRTIVIDGNGPDRCKYAINADRDLRKVGGTLHGISVSRNDNDFAGETGAKGVVGTGADGYRMTGSLPVVSTWKGKAKNDNLCDLGTVEITVDGESYHTLRIQGDRASGTDYVLEAGSELDPVHGHLQTELVTVNSADQVSGKRADGSVSTGADGYALKGSVSRLTMEDPAAATAYLDRREYHTLVVTSRSVSGGTDYTLEGGGQLQQVDGSLQGVEVSGGDEVSGSRATGSVTSGADGYRVTGALPSITLDEPRNARVLVDGQPYHSIVIDGRHRGGSTDYTIEGGGTLEQVDGTVGGVSVSKNSEDEVDGARATGTVASGADGFVVYGEVPTVWLSNFERADVTVDGRPVHTVVITGREKSGTTDYSVRVEGGPIRQIGDELRGHDVSIQSNDAVTATGAKGTVSSGADGFVSVGPVLEVHLSNPLAADVYVDGDPYHTVIIDSRNVEGSTDYTLESNPQGRIEPVEGPLHGIDVSIQSSDRASGSSASGSVNTGADAWVVHGTIESIDLTTESGAAVLIDGVNWERLMDMLPDRVRQELMQTPAPQVPDFRRLLEMDSIPADTTGGGAGGGGP